MSRATVRSRGYGSVRPLQSPTSVATSSGVGGSSAPMGASGSARTASRICRVLRQEPERGPGVEQVRQILERRPPAIVAVEDQQPDIELGRARVDHAALEREIAGRPRLAHGAWAVVEDEHRVDDRRPIEAPLGTELLDELFERQLLVRVRAEGHLLDALHEPAERRVAAHVDSQRHGVQEEPDDRLQFPLRAIGDRDADHHRLLAAGQMQERRVGRQERDEQRHRLSAAERLHRGDQSLREDEVLPRAVEALDRRPLPVGRQREPRRGAEMRLPVVQLPLEHVTLQVLTLRDREVDEPDRRLRQRRRLSLAECVVQRRQFAEDDAVRPRVVDDVMDARDEHVVRRREAEEAGAEDRAGGEIERPS